MVCRIKIESLEGSPLRKGTDEIKMLIEELLMEDGRGKETMEKISRVRREKRVEKKGRRGRREKRRRGINSVRVRKDKR